MTLGVMHMVSPYALGGGHSPLAKSLGGGHLGGVTWGDHLGEGIWGNAYGLAEHCYASCLLMLFVGNLASRAATQDLWKFRSYYCLMQDLIPIRDITAYDT